MPNPRRKLLPRNKKWDGKSWLKLSSINKKTAFIPNTYNGRYRIHLNTCTLQKCDRQIMPCQKIFTWIRRKKSETFWECPANHRHRLPLYSSKEIGENLKLSERKEKLVVIVFVSPLFNLLLSNEPPVSFPMSTGNRSTSHRIVLMTMPEQLRNA